MEVGQNSSGGMVCALSGETQFGKDPVRLGTGVTDLADGVYGRKRRAVDGAGTWLFVSTIVTRGPPYDRGRWDKTS